MARPRRSSAIHEPEYRDLLRRLREAREESGLTLKQVAERLDRSYQFVSKCELGERRIDPIDLKRFAEIYQKPVTYFTNVPGAAAERGSQNGTSQRSP